MNTSIHIKKEKASVILHDDLSIYHASTIKEHLLELLNTYDELEINIKEVNHLDLTFIQTFISFKNTAHLQNKKLAVHWDLPESFMVLLQKNGFDVNELFA